MREESVATTRRNILITVVFYSGSEVQRKGNEIWLLQSVEIVANSKKSLLQQKFRKKLYHFNSDSQLRSVI